jgi:AraC-like DNA-binding protein
MLAPPDHFAPRYFRGSEIPDTLRFGAWRNLLNRWLIASDAQPASDAPFRGSAYLRTLPDLRFGWGSIGATANQRTRKTVADDNDDLFLLVNLQGTIVASGQDGDVKLRSGDAYLMRCEQTGAFGWRDSVKLLCLRVRQSGITPLLNGSCNAPVLIPKHNETLRLLIRFLRLLDETQPLASPELRAVVTRQIQDLLALVAGARGDAKDLATNRSLDAVRLKSVQEHVERHLVEHDLSLEALAFRFGISRRSLQRVFEADGTNFSEFVRQRRLAKAYSALSKPGAETPIAEIALGCGFCDISYFNRAFRARYHATPSDVRAQTRERFL